MALQIPLLALFLAILTSAHIQSSQVPLVAPTETFASSSSFNFSSPAPHYFASVNGLLKQWPQTFFPNGHVLAAAEIPPFTKLYHGRQDDEAPPSPEWLAFDIEMSYGIMGSTPSSWLLTYTTTRPVRVLYFDGESATLMGAGRMDTQMLALFANVTGPEDGRPGGFRGLWDEYLRANGLCDWLLEKGLRGPGWGFEGIVRMNAGFEIIWCDFNSPSLRLVSWMNVSAPLIGGEEQEELSKVSRTGEPAILNKDSAEWEDESEMADLVRQDPTSYYPLPPSPTRSDRATDPPNPAQPPNWRHSDREPFLRSQGWGWFRSATTHYSGERRVKLHSCGILSYYSPTFKSQALARAQFEQERLNLTDDGFWSGPGPDGDRTEALAQLLRRRRSHRLDMISVRDAVVMQESTSDVLREIVTGNISCSGMDWTIITDEIVSAYGPTLMAFSLLLETFEDVPSNNDTSVRLWLSQMRSSTHAFLLPFIEYPSNSTAPDVWSETSGLFLDTFARCRFHHTRLLENVTLNEQESLLKWSVESTMSEICNSLISVGFSVEDIWARNYNDQKAGETREDESPWREKSRKEVERWTWRIQELMAWLGWAGEWTRCETVCEWDEECYIPMWPMTHSDRSRHRRPPGDFKPPGHGDDGKGPGGPERRPPGDGHWPGMPFQDETDLWKPKCVKAEYIMG